RLREVPFVVGRGDGLDRLRVGAHDLAEPVADAGQRTTLPALGEQLVGAERPRRQDDSLRRDGPGAPPAEPGAGAPAGDRVALAPSGCAHRPHVGDHAVRQHLDPELLGEPEVVLDQRVLGAVATADHAAAAADAAGAPGALAAEIGIVDLLARL